jgi:surfactin synthase thioesterase subunit
MTWFRYRRERPDALARLFCLPFAGGSALTYRPWVAFAPAEIDLCPIQLPGRDDRRREAVITRMPDLVDALADAIAPLTDLPFALFGHSMGARVAFELTRTLRRRGMPLPVHLFASGSRGPHVPADGPDLHRMSDHDLIAEVRKMGGTPDDVLADAEMMSLLLPVLRADFELLETYVFTADAPLECDITAFRGAADPCASRAGTEAWGELTSSRFALKTYPGNHFFLTPNGRAILTEASVRIFRSMEELAA